MMRVPHSRFVHFGDSIASLVSKVTTGVDRPREKLTAKPPKETTLTIA